MRAPEFSDAAPGWALLVVALLAVCYSAVAVPPAPGGPTEATYRLQAESLLRDGDRTYAEDDRVRFAGKDWPALGTQVVVSDERGSLRFHRPLPYSLALAPFVVIAPERGPYILNLLLFSGLSLGLAVRLSRDSPRSAPYWSVALFFGTVVFSYVRAVGAELFVSALLVLAYVLTRASAPRRELPQMAARPAGLGGLALRWLGVGALLGLVVLQEPLYVVFFVAFLVPAVRSRAEVAWAVAIAGLVAVLLVAWLAGGNLFSGVAPWAADSALTVQPGDALADVAKWASRLESVEAPEIVWDPQLTLWNSIYALFGRNTGLLVGFLPLVLLASSARWVRWSLWLAGGVILVGTIVLDPFNFFGGPEALGFRRMVPAAVLVFFTVRASTAAWPALLAGALGVTVLGPLWLGLSEHPGQLRGQSVVRPLASVLPYETSQRYVPASGEVFSRMLLMRTANDGLLPGSRDAQFVLRSGIEGELMVASSRRLAYLDFEFGPEAGSDLEVRGGKVENLLFRPEGGVTFRVTPSEARIRHRVWARDDTHFIHMLKLSMPDAAGRDQSFSVTGRPAEAEDR